jgi:hypothetical protein
MLTSSGVARWLFGQHRQSAASGKGGARCFGFEAKIMTFLYEMEHKSREFAAGC